jgi:hypothetical protein
MRIICISGKAGHGKDASAAFLGECLKMKGKTVLIAHFADLLKYICKTFFGWNGEKDAFGRTLLQYVGTDAIRKKEPGFWVGFIMKILRFFDGCWDFVILPDCRFPNEYEAFKENGFDAVLVEVRRKNYESPLSHAQLAHESENAFDGYKPDYAIMNDSGLDVLKENVVSFAEEILLA